MENPLESLNFFHKYVTKDNQIIELSCVKAKDAQSKCIFWIFDIMERNMKSLYEQSDWGWDPVAKQKELTESTAWYLVATSNDKFVGFSHFRFDIDYREEVLYWYVDFTDISLQVTEDDQLHFISFLLFLSYEIQLESAVRRKGLGHFMMSALESMASKNKMRKVVLTVLKHNPSAMQFFYSLG